MNAIEQRQAQFALIQSIREALPAGYRAVRWNETQICIEYVPASNPDNRQRCLVRDEHSWAVLKATLGLL